MGNEFLLEQLAEEVQRAINNALNPDKTLSKDGVPADAKTVGDELGLKLDNAEVEYAMELSDELMPSVISWSGAGWTQTENGGFAHTVGQTDPLTITLTEETGENLYMVSFHLESATNTSAPDASVAVYPSIGGSDAFALYDGNTGTRTYEKVLRSVANGNLVFQPCNPSLPTDNTYGNFDGTIRNISLKKVLSVRGTAINLYDENGNVNVEMRQTPTARYNIYMGIDSGKNDITAKGNVGIGKDTLEDTTSGFWNVAIGQGALQSNTVGSRNIAIGRVALSENTSGDRNIAIGTFALNRARGFCNIAMGADAAWYLANGNYNISIGMQSFGKATRGNDNIVLGFKAYYSAESGESNVVIGNHAYENAKNSENSTVIGDHAFPNTQRSARSIAIGYKSGSHDGQLNDVICIGNFSYATKSGQTVLGGYKTTETVVKGDFIVEGTDGVKRQIVFNTDGTCSWTTVQ